ncbi:xanthine dehydrogenase family protein molybdopterin-binding subunit [Bradyrhizobium australiense]|uniref:Xanthine dehydrogenase family protein molybdopterin-binding subunit n=1 Tax=Bradyrhizobium australiense TaxID=2721161 RepID=A0A7Y4LWN2_9BRAD|nr:xanthine dehydrogenase family protein molybdopterin-binding subunit [Bradyrhizobium australiense]NOJ41627.1 xanthine dehydrogenase family protein molybdopterin-binding subunit [Bradyrhizobium australiense]
MASYIGSATSRIDGRAKVTGEAKYAGEFNVAGLVHGYVVDSAIPKGRIVRIDTSGALGVAGVIDVLTHRNRPQMADKDDAYKDEAAPEKGSPYRPLYDDRILFSGQPLALVLAEDWETARVAASLVKIEYQKEPHVTDLQAERAKAFAIDKPEKPRGDAGKAFASAAVRHAAEYFIPTEHHNPMELFASTVIWDNGQLTVYDKTQGVQNVQQYLCGVFKMKADEVRVMSPYMGGGFGSGLRPQYQVVLAALAARALKRPVRVMLSRAQMYALGHRPASIERLALGANSGGTLEAMTHEAIAVTSQFEEFARNDTGWGNLLYKTPNAKFEHTLVKLDVPTSCDMRAPGAATGVYALECAMDELAVALKTDPVQLRLQCYSDRDQGGDIPYTSKQLRECYRQGAAAFGWDKRKAEPRSMREGNDLVGWGMASGVWEALQMPTTVRIVLTANGHAEVATAASDIGTGTYTIMAQVAADMLGLPIDNISVKLGDSTLPQCPLEGGSWIASSVCNAIANTARAVRDDLLKLAIGMKDSPLAGAGVDDVALIDGKIVSKRDAAHAVSIASAMQAGNADRITREEANKVAEDKSHARNVHSAIFAEVKVDEQLGVIRVTRVVNAVAAGRILNPKTAHSQVMGGVVWGIGMALHEETLFDHRYGRVMNANIAEYHVPVNADVHDIKVIFVDEPDQIVNPLGIKGLGEIGIVGVAAAIANAVYHATGKRVRDLPITLDKVVQFN